MGEIRPLAGFRFLAAFYVFCFHMNMPFRFPLIGWPNSFTNFLNQGRLGVTAFFVLSGFVLVYSHLKDFSTTEIKPLTYWVGFIYKRLARLYPVFLSGLLLIAAISIATKQLPSPILVLMSATFVQTYFPSIAMIWYDGGTWSVANEFFFYLLFPLALPLLLRVQSKQVLLLIIGICALIGAALGAWSWLQPGLYPLKISYAFPACRFPEFLAGMAAAILVLRFQWRVSPWVAAGGAVLALVYLSIIAPQLGGSAVIHNWLMVPVLALLLSAMTRAPRHVLFGWLGTDVLRYLGHVSYAFYIAQVALSGLLDWLVASQRIQKNSVWAWPGAFIVCLAVAVILHHLIEKPAHRWLLARWARYIARPVAVHA